MALWFLEHGTQLGGAIGGLAGAILTLWTLVTKIKKSIRLAIIDAVDDKFGSKQDMQRIEEHMENLAYAVQAMTYETSRILDHFEGKKSAAQGN